ncbi:MAG: tetratricopeptide repeat protein [Planctomycetota bacterium]|jgi:tetratricopeptide (TPR) repeat protein
MRISLWNVLWFILFAGLIVGCGGKLTPEEKLQEADQAYRADKDYDKAMKFYRKVLDWEGEGGPTQDQRYQASFNLVRCKVAKEDYEGAVDILKEMQKIYGEKVTFKNYANIISDLAKKRAVSQAIDVLELATKAFPEKEEALGNKAEELLKLGVSDKDAERLKSLGYL